MAPVVAAALISGAVNLIKAGGDLYSKNKASDASKQAIQYQKDKDAMLQNWYDRRYNEDATQRADAQQLLNYTAEQIRKRNNNAAGTAAVIGGTEESVAAEKAANASAMADAVGRIAASGEKQKDSIENAYLSESMNQKDKMSGIEMGRSNQIASAGSALGGLNIDVGSLVKAFGGSE